MKSRSVLMACFVSATAVLAAGCTSTPNGLSTPQAQASLSAPKNFDPQAVQATTMSFSARYSVAMADLFDRVRQDSPSLEAQEMALRCKLTAGLGAMGNAVNPNPIVGFMDMALKVTLTRQTMEDPWAKGVFGAEHDAMITQTLAAQEADIWNLANNYLNADQIKELKALAQRWREEHPHQRYVGSSRLADFPEAKQNNPANQIAAGIFNLVRLDPFTGLDPAVRQVEESRVLAERMFFYLQNMPVLVSWQTDLLYIQMVSQPQVAQLFKDMSVVSANTTGFTQATAKFADASSNFATTIETFRTQWPEQQATLARQMNDVATTQRVAAMTQAANDITILRDATVKQLNDLVAVQREGALKQAGEEIAAQRDAAIKQLNASIIAQQDLLTKNLQTVTDGSIDRLYQRLRSLILIAAGAILGVILIHRLVSRLSPHV